jgi:hypothetical protein
MHIHIPTNKYQHQSSDRLNSCSPGLNMRWGALVGWMASFGIWMGEVGEVNGGVH